MEAEKRGKIPPKGLLYFTNLVMCINPIRGIFPRTALVDNYAAQFVYAQL